MSQFHAILKSPSVMDLATLFKYSLPYTTFLCFSNVGKPKLRIVNEVALFSFEFLMIQ